MWMMTHKKRIMAETKQHDKCCEELKTKRKKLKPLIYRDGSTTATAGLVSSHNTIHFHKPTCCSSSANLTAQKNVAIKFPALEQMMTQHVVTKLPTQHLSHRRQSQRS